MPAEPRQSVDNRLITVDMLGLLFDSAGTARGPAVLDKELPDPDAPASTSLRKSSSVRPFFDRATGSIPRRIKRSARDAKQRRAPSATCKRPKLFKHFAQDI